MFDAVAAFQTDMINSFSPSFACSTYSDNFVIEKQSNIATSEACGALCITSDHCHYIFMVGTDCYFSNYNTDSPIAFSFSSSTNCYIKSITSNNLACKIL